MKTDGHGQAAVLSPAQLRVLFTQGFDCPRDRALFGICLYSACRISEALQLRVNDLKGQYIVFRKGNTKGKLATREVRIIPPLQALLDDYDPGHKVWLFPGQRGRRDFLSRHSADRIFRGACNRVGIEGASTHSFRRTALTRMCSGGIPLRHIQKISGHCDLGMLSRYLEVSDEELLAAVLKISF